MLRVRGFGYGPFAHRITDSADWRVRAHPASQRISLPCSLIDDGWALLIDDQHQSLSLKGSLGISRVVGEVFCHLNLAERE